MTAPSPFRSFKTPVEKDASSTSTARESVAKDRRRARRGANFTPEYKAWLARQAKKGRNP